MHGRRKKDVVEPTAEELAKQSEQVKTAQALFKNLLAQRQAKVYSVQMLDMTTKALMFHPEFPTLWGYRREILLCGEIEGDKKQMLENEMKLLEKALRKSQKVYSIWFHRKWTVEQLFNICKSEADANTLLDVELELCSKLLEVDERNFHCWNHRAYVMGMMLDQQQSDSAPKKEQLAAAAEAPQTDSAAPAQSADDAVTEDVSTEAVPAAGSAEAASGEVTDAAKSGDAEKSKEPKQEAKRIDLVELDLKLSKDLIHRNFSNYSAWHLRALLQQPSPAGAEESDKTTDTACADARIDVAAELEWVQQGIYTEPNDQSIWLYHHWLTVLGRGHERLRVTYCAVLTGELFVFFSAPACMHRPDGAESWPVSVNLCTGSDSTLAAEAISGELFPMGPSSASRARTRSLPRNRRVWAAAWRFKPSSEEAAQKLSSESVQEIEIELSVDVIGSHATGAPAHGQRCLTFRGPPLLCGQSSASGSKPSPAARALLPPELEPSRAELLKTELERIEELLEIEPDCKWALLSRNRLASTGASGSEDAKKVEESCAEGYSQICALDPLRKGFYEEARAECLMRVRILSWMNSVLSSALELSNLSLRHLSPTVTFAAFGVKILDVSNNNLREMGPLLSLLSLEDLRASHNRLVGDVSEALVLPHLRRLDVSHNMMHLRGQATTISCDDLREVDMSSNAAVLGVVDTSATATEPFAPPARGANPSILARLLAGLPSDALSRWEVECDAASQKCICRLK